MSRPPSHETEPVPGAHSRSPGRRRQATVSTTPTTASSGTANRSAFATRRGPPATIAVDSTPSPMAQARSEPGPPAMRAHAEAAITLLTAIQAKFVT